MMSKYDTSSWRSFNIQSLFRIEYGNKFDRCNMIEAPDSSIAFVTRTASNNGVGAFVDEVEGVVPYPAGCLTIALGGSLGSTFLQPHPFYTAQNVAVLIPHDSLSLTTLQKLFIATLIKKECDLRFVAFGRELNTHINRDFCISLPAHDDGSVDWDSINKIIASYGSSTPSVRTHNTIAPPMIPVSEWHPFKIKYLFPDKCRERGKVHSQEDLPDGNDFFYVGAKKNGNGIMARCGYDSDLISEGNCLIFICNGQGSVGYSLYMDKPFMASGDLVLGYNPHLNQYTGLFLVSVLDKERFKYSFGRKYGKYLPDVEIFLPSTDGIEPDWQYMEDYIKSLPYGDLI